MRQKRRGSWEIRGERGNGRGTEQARCRSMDEEDARFIEAAGNGASLAEIQATLVDGDDPDVTHQLLERFRRLVGEGLFLKLGRPHVAASP